MPGANLEKARKQQQRPGPGRKPLGKVRVMFKLYPETKKFIDERAAAAKLTKSEFVEQAILRVPRQGSSAERG